MCLLFESVKLLDGCPRNLQYHEARMKFSSAAVFGSEISVDLTKCLNSIAIPTAGLYKCRIVYGRKIEHIEIIPYQIKMISSLKVADAGRICYNHKFVDRSDLNNLRKQFPEVGEILLIRDSLITDTTFTNVAFYDGADWLTPEKPLLAGTRRRLLIQQNKIKPAEIRTSDISSFSKVSLINAMMELGECVVDTADIFR